MKETWVRATTVALALVVCAACGGRDVAEEAGQAAGPQVERHQAKKTPAESPVTGAPSAELPATAVQAKPKPPRGYTEWEERPGMAYIPAGEFLMGSAADDRMVYPWEKPREQPQHPVYVDAFYMDTYEVTKAQYERFDPKHPRHGMSPCDDCLVRPELGRGAIARADRGRSSLFAFPGCSANNDRGCFRGRKQGSP